MVDCREALLVLYEYLDKEMDEGMNQEIKIHIELCRSCFDCFEFEGLLRNHMREKTDHICPDRLKARIQKLIDEFVQ